MVLHKQSCRRASAVKEGRRQVWHLGVWQTGTELLLLHKPQRCIWLSYLSTLLSHMAVLAAQCTLQGHPKRTVTVLAVFFPSCPCSTCCPALSCTMQLGYKGMRTLPPRLLQCCCSWLYPSQGYSSNSTSIRQHNSSSSRSRQRHNSSSAHRWYRSHCYSHPSPCHYLWHDSSSCNCGTSPCCSRADRTISGDIHIWSQASCSAV
jgi:hypothetical protein